MDYLSQVNQAKRIAELQLKRAELLGQLAEVESECRALESETVAKPEVAGQAPKRRGRPPKAKVKPELVAGQAPKRRGRPPKAKSEADQTPKEKRIELPGLLETIIQNHGKPMKHEELVVAAREAGYKSDAKDFSNMVYQALLKMVKKGTLNKANEGRDAEYTFRAA